MGLFWERDAKRGGEVVVNEMSGEVWVIQCCACKQYFDLETREKTDKPPDNASVTHTYCDICVVKLEKEIAAMTAPVNENLVAPVIDPEGIEKQV